MMRELLVVVGIVTLLVGGFLGFNYFFGEKGFSWEAEEDIPLFNNQQSNALIYNGNPLTDHTIFTQEEIQESNRILGGNYGMYALINPAYAQDIDGKDIEVDMQFTYMPFLQEGALSHLNAPNNNPRNVSIVLVFEGDLIKGDALLKKNVSYEYKYGSSENAWINNREVLYDSYVDLGTPDDSCVYGNTNNTKMFAVTYGGNTTNYCFTSFTPNGQGNVLLSGNYNKPIDVIETRWEEKYVNVKDRFESLGKNLLGNGFSYYRAENVYFEENDTHELKLIFTPKDREKNGKWHIVMYETEYGLINSITDDRYVYIDPWWDSDWTYEQNVTNLTGNIISLKIDYNANMKSDFSDLRFLTPDETSEYPYAKIFNNATTAIYKVQTNGSTSLMMYYGNPAASYTGDIQGVYPPGLTYALFFDNGYNESVTGQLLTSVSASSFNYSYRNTTYWVFNQTGHNYPAPYGLTGLTPSSPTTWTFVANIYPMSAWDGAYGPGGTISAFKDGGSSQQKYFMVSNNGGAKLQQIVGTGSGQTIAELPIGLNAWHYVVGQANTTLGNKVWLDGNTTSNTQAQSAIGTSASQLDIGVYSQSSGNKANAMNGSIDYWLYFTRYLDVNEIGYLKEQTAPYAVYGAEETQASDASPTVSLINPVDHHDETDNSLIYFGANISDDQLVDNYTLYVWNLDGTLNTSSFYDINQAHNIVNNTLNLQNGSYTWNYYAYDNSSQLGMGTNRSLNVSVTTIPLSVSVTLNSPADNNYSNYNLNRLYATLTRLASNSTNGTFYLWDASNQLINYTSIINGSSFIAKSVSPVNNKDLDSVTNLQAGALIYVKNDIYISLLGMNGANLRAFNITDYDGNQIYYSSNLTDGNNNVTFNNVLLLGNNYYRLEFQSLVSTNFVNSNTTAYTNFPIDKDDFIILNNSNGGANTTNTIYYAPAVINYTLKDIDYYDTSFYISNDGVYHWNTYACAENATASACAYAQANYTLTVDTTDPSINIIHPATLQGEGINGQNMSLNYSISDTNLQACWYEYNNVNYTVNCALNSSFTYVSGVNSIKVWANDSVGNSNYSQRDFTFTYVTNNIGYDPSVFETSQHNFTFNITYNSTYWNSASASIIYNGTTYGANKDSAGSVVTFSKVVPITTVDVESINKSFYWQINLANTTSNVTYLSTTSSHQVNATHLQICNATANVPYINLSFYNETVGEERVNANLDGSFTYSLSSDFATNKTYTYTNATESIDYQFCFWPSDKTIYVQSDFDYDNSYSEQRSFINNTLILTNTTLEKYLYLLPTTDGLYISIIVQDQSLNRLENALISITRSSDSVLIEQKYTDGTGIAAFWLDTGTNYKVDISKSGYEDYSTSLTPSTSPVTYTMTSTSANTGGNQGGISIVITPQNNKLENGTNYEFTFNISSEDQELDEYGFSLWNSTTRLISDITGTQTSGEGLEAIYNTEDQSYIILRWYYIIDGSYTNGTKQYYVVNTAGTDTSIATFIDDLGGFIGNGTGGVFGIEQGDTEGDFSLAIVIFLITFFSAGAMTYRYGITGITATMFVIFSIILFFDVGAGIMPNPLNAIPHFITVLTGLITIGFFIREVYQ